jgi:putative methyltransferase (TIGR04325 family)
MKISTFASTLLKKFVKTKIYGSYSEAVAECSKDGYENDKIVQVVVEKTLRYQKDLFQNKRSPIELNPTAAYSVAAILASLRSNKITVIDFGGAAGAHYFLLRSLIPQQYTINWLVVETPAMVAAAQPVLANQELNFTSDLKFVAKSMKQIDLLHTSGTLQCVNNPYTYLKKLLSLRAKYILFNRLALTQGNHDVICIHKSQLSWNGPGKMPSKFRDTEVRYPFIFPQESVFMKMLSKNYKPIVTFTDESGIFAINNEPIIGKGILAKLKR